MHDLPIQIRRLLSEEWSDLDSQYSLPSVVRTLRSKLGPQVTLNLENCLMDVVCQEIAFSFVDPSKKKTASETYTKVTHVCPLQVMAVDARGL